MLSLFFSKKVYSQSMKDKAYLLVKYDETSMTDSTDLLKKNYDVMGLEIGKSMSKFYSISLLETKNAMMEQIKQTGALDMRNLTMYILANEVLRQFW